MALLLAALLVSAEPDLSISIAPEQPEVGLVMTLTLTVSGAEGADCSLAEAPAIEGARLSAPSGPSRQSYTEVINGRARQSVSTLWQFELVPEREGVLVVPAFRLICRGADVATRPRTLKVGPATLIPDLVRIDVAPSASEVWVGQVIEMDVELSIVETAKDMLARGGLELVLPWLEDQPGLHMLEPPVPSCSRGVMTALPSERQIPTCTGSKVIDGRRRDLYSQTIPMLATAPGRYQLPDSRFSARVVVQRGSGGRDPFGFFQGLRSVPSRTVVTDGIGPGPLITIREPPADGRPADYTNAVGRFRFQARAEPTSLAVGESCHLTLTLSPEQGRAGQLPLIEWPPFEQALTDFRLFGKQDDASSRARVLELEISPITEQVSAIPELSFSFFDPGDEHYHTLRAGPIALDVSVGGREGLAELVTPQEILNDLETIRTDMPAPEGAHWPLWLGPGLAALLLGFVELRGRALRWRAEHPATVARRGARAALERELSRAGDVRAVAAAFSYFLSARFDGPVGGLTAEEAAPRVGDDELRERLTETVAGWEAAYLGGAPLPLERAAEQARALARDLERLA